MRGRPFLFSEGVFMAHSPIPAVAQDQCSEFQNCAKALCPRFDHKAGSPRQNAASSQAWLLPHAPAVPKVLLLFPPPWKTGNRMGWEAARLRTAEVVPWDPVHLTGVKSEPGKVWERQPSAKPAPSLICLFSLGLSQAHTAPEEGRQRSYALPCMAWKLELLD